MSSSRQLAFKILACRAEDVRWARRSIQYAVDPARVDLQRDYNEALVRFGTELMRIRMMEAAIKASGEWA